jgi:hypothetical protein
MAKRLILTASGLLVSPALADQPPYLGVGYLHSRVWGDTPTVGHGLEVTFGNTATAEGVAVVVQRDWNEDHSDRLMVGGQASLGPLGLEVGWSQRDVPHGGNSHGLHLAPFLSLGGIVHVAGRYVLPVADRGVGTEYALVLGVKIPFVFGSMNLFRMPHGRPLRGVDGAVVEVPVWALPAPAPPLGLGGTVRRALGQAWLADARMEHASVAAFERLARHLALLGAPSALQAEARRAADDERRHAAACFALAGRLLGLRLGAPPVPVPHDVPPTLAALAVDSLVEGCLGEGAAALQAEWALPHCTDAATACTLAAIATEEAAHARLAAAVVAWAEGVGGAAVHQAVRRARAHLPAPPPSEALGHDLQAERRHGRAPAPLQTAAWLATRARLAA